MVTSMISGTARCLSVRLMAGTNTRIASGPINQQVRSLIAGNLRTGELGMKLHTNAHKLTSGEIGVLRDALAIVSGLHKEGSLTMSAAEEMDLTSAREKLEGWDAK